MTPQLGKTLNKIGYTLFLVSMVLPATRLTGVIKGDWLWGWQCAYFCLLFFPNPVALGYVGSNLGVLLSPLLRSRRARKQRFYLRVMGIFALLSGAHALRWMVPSSDSTLSLGIGYWVWTLSFFVLGVGFLMQSRTQTQSMAQAVETFHPKTEAEMAAEKELEAALQN